MIEFLAALITAFCRGTFSDANQQGLAAIAALRDSQAIERREAAERRAEQERQQREAEQQRERAEASLAAARQRLRECFLGLNELKDHQQRGFALERFLNDFFEFEGLRG